MRKLLLPIFSLAILVGLVLIAKTQASDTSNIPQNPSLGSYWVRDFLAQNPEYRDMPITERTEKSITFQRSDGQLVTQSVDFPIHYKDARGQWQPLDTTLKFYPETGEWGVPGFTTKIKPDGKVSIKEKDGKIFSQRTASYGNLNSETGEFSTLGEFQEGSANGDTLIRKSENIEHKIKLTDLGVKEEMILPQAPAEISEGDYLVMQTEIGSEKLFPDGWLEDADLSEYHLPPPFSFDANQKQIITKRYAQYSGGIQYVFTGVNVSDLSDSQFPVTIDPEVPFEGSTNDGHVINVNNEYMIYDTANATMLVGQDSDPEAWGKYRAFLKFNTSAIPDGNTITQVNLKLVTTSKMILYYNFDVQIVKQNWSAQDPLSDVNKDAAFNNCISSAQDDNIWQNTSAISENIQYPSGNLNTAWVNKLASVDGGYTYYSLISSRDRGGYPYDSDAEYLHVASQNHTTSAYRPILTVVHVPPPLFKLFYNVKLFQNVKFLYTP